MRKLILIMLFSPMFALAQLQGIGIFKVGLSTSSIIEAIAKENKVEVKESYGYGDLQGYNPYTGKKTNKILYLREKDGVYPNVKYLKSPNVKVYYLNYYEVSGVPLTKIYLSFYKDTLYEINCESNTAIREAMNIKYGNGKIETTEKEIKCVSPFAGEYTLKETASTIIWKSEIPNIAATDIQSVYYDSKCQRQYTSVFYVSNQAVAQVAIREDVAGKNRQKEKEQGEKKKDLKDF